MDGSFQSQRLQDANATKSQTLAFYKSQRFWVIDFYPVRVLGRVVDLLIRMPNPSPTLDKYLASMGAGILSSIGVGVWRKSPEAFPGSNTTLDTFQSASFSATKPVTVELFFCLLTVVLGSSVAYSWSFLSLNLSFFA